MSQALTKARVKHVAQLAKLTLTAAEISKFTNQLQEVIGYFEQLAQVDTSAVEPTYQTLDGTQNVWREDIVRQSLSQKEALSPAARKFDGYFLVPSVFDKTNREGGASRTNPKD